jgi:Cd2+/Zn2+-exporting ATPase
MPSHDHEHDHKHKHEEDANPCGCDHGEVATCGLDDSCGCGHDHGPACTACGPDHKDDDKGWNLLIAGGAVIGLSLLLHQTAINSMIPNLLLVATMIVVGYPLAKNGVKSLLRGSIGINFLVTIAAIGATLIGQYEEGALVVFLFSVSLKLEVLATDRARHAIQALMELRPEVATLKREDDEVVVPVDQVLPGEVFIVKPGDRIPLDGIVLTGSTTVDQSTITGESFPIEKNPTDDIYAGTINLDGYLTVETKRASTETMLASILRMVQEAEGRRSPTETFVNKFAKYYTPIIIILAIIIALTPPLIFNAPLIPSIYNSLVLLVIGCPCALTIATPVAMVSAITSASRNGVLVKGSNYIESINKASAFTFDKTGTLTRGKLKIIDIIPYGASRNTVLGIAAALEAKSNHPIATAILEVAENEGVKVADVGEFKSITGRGVEAKLDGKIYRIGSQRLFNEQNITYEESLINSLESEGKTVIMLSEDEKIIGVFSLMDQSRTNAKETILELRRKGLKVEMLTGDNEATAKAIATELGFNGYHANLLPDEKVGVIEKLREKETVVMVGDGVNDAPALAAADVGIAMGGLGSDIALETADIVLLEDDLSKISYLLKLSRVTMTRIRENITISLFVKLAIVFLGALGTISLWMAVILGDVGLTLLVILNSIRISRVKLT